MRSAENTAHDLIAISNDLRRHINDDLAALGYVELRPSFAPLLSKLWQGGVPQGLLAEAMGVSAQAASQTVGLAEVAGYVVREPNPDDGRSKVVVLTDLGRRFVGDGAAAITARAAQYASVVGVSRFARFDRTLARLCAELGIADEVDPVASLEPRASIIAVSMLAEDAMAQLRRAMSAAKHSKISSSLTHVLVHIGPDGTRSSDLARVQQVSRQAISASLHELEARGYVVRRGDTDDARGVVFIPTPRGRKVLDDYVAGIDALEQHYAALIGDQRFAELARTARDLCSHVRLERTLAGVAPSAQGIGAALGTRSKAELTELADDLWRVLGSTDALRLCEVLGRLAVDRRPAAEPSEGTADTA